MTERERTDIKFEIVEQIGVLNSYPTGWNKELNVVKWNDKSEKYDVRDWSPGHERMSRGITLFEDELKKLAELCSDVFGTGDPDGPVSAQQQEQEPVQPPVHSQQADRVAEEEVPF